LTRADEPGLEAALASQLLAAARHARQHAYAPYSRFAVGAALLATDGSVVTGCNVENASFSLSNCAERVALQKAVSEGHRSFRAIGIVGAQDEIACMPCGSCRQVLIEFSPELLVVTPGGEDRAPDVTPLHSLLPAAFTRERLTQVDPGDG
jgi:cytidine deaminase